MNTDSSIARIVSLARTLGPLAGDVVFIGGAVAPLLHTEQILPRPRPTKDVDGVIASHDYGDSDQLHQTMRGLGFAHVVVQRAHAHRWRSPDGILFDLVPAGTHLGGSGNDWDWFALQNAVTVTIEGTTFRHVSAAAFIAMKVEAFKDRGYQDMRSSHDIEDIIALIASRPSIAMDVATAPTEIVAKVSNFASALINAGVADEVLAAHLNNVDDTEDVFQRVLERLIIIASLIRA